MAGNVVCDKGKTEGNFIMSRRSSATSTTITTVATASSTTFNLFCIDLPAAYTQKKQIASRCFASYITIRHTTVSVVSLDFFMSDNNVNHINKTLPRGGGGMTYFVGPGRYTFLAAAGTII